MQLANVHLLKQGQNGLFTQALWQLIDSSYILNWYLECVGSNEIFTLVHEDGAWSNMDMNSTVWELKIELCIDT
jgi:hypothetical protein